MERSRRVLYGVLAAALLVVAGVAVYAVVTAPGPSGLPPGGPPPAGYAACGPVGAGGAANWSTYHGSNDRSGFVATGPSGPVRPLWSDPVRVDGAVYAEPLACGGKLFVATENNTVYALNVTTGAVLWHTHLGTPVPGASLPCGDIDPSGITGTPAIDPANGALYVVAFLAPASHVLFGLRASDGLVATRVGVDPSGSVPSAQQQRGALAIANGVVYVPFGGLAGDCAQYHGWVVGAPVNGTANFAYQVPTNREGGIWAPAGVTPAPNGTLYVATGNGDSTTNYDLGDSVLALSPSLALEGYFAPSDWAGLNRNDTDLGSLAPTLLPGGDVFQVGKAGVGYLLDGARLGGIGGEVAQAPVCAGAYGGTARVGTEVIVPCTDGVVAVRTSASGIALAWHSSRFDAGAPIVAGGRVWVVDESNASLLALNLTSGGLELAFPLGSVEHFISPTAAGPEEVAVAADDEVYAFGGNGPA